MENKDYFIDPEEIVIKLKEVLERIKRIKLGGYVSTDMPSLMQGAVSQ